MTAICFSNTKRRFGTTQILQDLQLIVNPASSWKSYRTALTASGPPLIPYIGVYLSDLTFIEDGNPDFFEAPEHLVNFSKCQMVYSILQQIAIYQTIPYDLPISVHNGLGEFFNELPCLDEESQYEVSLYLEPKQVTAA